MKVAALAGETDFDGWRAAARAFRQAGVRPEAARFRIGEGEGGLFDEPLPVAAAARGKAMLRQASFRPLNCTCGRPPIQPTVSTPRSSSASLNGSVT